MKKDINVLIVYILLSIGYIIWPSFYYAEVMVVASVYMVWDTWKQWRTRWNKS